MIEFRQALLVFLFSIVSGAALAQNNTNSPYTRYGYGQLSDVGSSNSKAMGGVAYGLRDGSQVNFANPASYTAVDSLTFIFDGAVSLQNTNFSNGTLKQNAKNSSFDYVTMQFRLAPWCGMSVGLLPYSNVGYSMTEYRVDEAYPESSSSVTYSGDGGLHQLYAGVGFKIFKNLSVGANFSYLWGDISHTTSLRFPSDANQLPYSRVLGASLKSYKLDFGVQYTQMFGKKHAVTLGAVVSPGHDLSSKTGIDVQVGNQNTGASVSSRDSIATYGIPLTVGVGLAYVYNNRLTVGADFMLQQWDKVSFMNAENAFCSRTRIGVGAEYIPNPMGRNYLSHVKYRIGAYYSQPYYKINGLRAADEYGVSGGFAFPLMRTQSLISVTAQYVRTKGKHPSFLDENTLRISIGVTFNERWFFKSRVD